MAVVGLHPKQNKLTSLKTRLTMHQQGLTWAPQNQGQQFRNLPGIRYWPFARDMPKNFVWASVVLLVIFSRYITEELSNASVSTRPDVVNLASILTFNSIIGKVAKIALPIDDVNADPTILSETKLKITFHDSNCSAFMSMMEALQVMKTDSVALIGPQSSVLAHVISHVANELQVLLLSLTATDPTLSALQYPFFVRTTHNDLYQMAAISYIVRYYEWRSNSNLHRR